MNTFMQKLGVLAAALSAVLSAAAYDFEVDGIYYNIYDQEDKEVEVTYKEQDSVTEEYCGDVAVPASVTYGGEQYSVTAIGDWAFSYCSNLTSITLPNSVKTIWYGAFEHCSSLTSITIPNSVTHIWVGAFEHCSSLTSITIPNSVTSIDDGAFSECSSLTSVTLPNSVKHIGIAVFKHCSSLTSITIPNSVTYINEEAFYGCSGLTSIIIPNSVTSIWYRAFAGCSSLTSISIPNSVTYIGLGAFSGCRSLTSISIPNSVTIIGEGAFSCCSSLTSITSLAVTPPECGDYVFDGIDKHNCTLYVPAESIEAYKQAYGWRDFVFVEKMEAGIEAVEVDADGAVEVYNLKGVKVANLLENLPVGLYIINGHKVIVR